MAHSDPVYAFLRNARNAISHKSLGDKVKDIDGTPIVRWLGLTLLFRAWDACCISPFERMLRLDKRDVFHLMRNRFRISASEVSWMGQWCDEAKRVVAELPRHFVSETYDFVRAITLDDLLREDILSPMLRAIHGTGKRWRFAFYPTPQPVVDLMLRRATHHWKGGTESRERYPLLLDPCSGTGNFIAATLTDRVMSALNFFKDASPREAELEYADLLQSVKAFEIEETLARLAAINVLIRLSPLVALLPSLPKGASACLSLPVRHGDAFSLLAEQRRSKPIQLVVSNPPYLGEKHNRELLCDIARRFPRARDVLCERSDYWYFFVLLGLEQLEPGGVLSYITTSYWLEADGAQPLRDYLLEQGVLLEFIDFGEQRVFPGAPGQHSGIFVVRKGAPKRGHRMTAVSIEGNSSDLGEAVSAAEAALLGEPVQAQGSDSNIKCDHVLWTPEKLKGRRWNLHINPDWARFVSKLEHESAPLGEILSIHQGILPGAIRVKTGDLPLLGDSSRAGEGVFLLSEEEARRLKLTDRETKLLLKPCAKSTDLTPYLSRHEGKLFLLYVVDKTDLKQFPHVRRHLERFRPLLERKREFKIGLRKWYALHWARRPELFDQPKLMTPYRAVRNCFAYVPDALYCTTDIYVLRPRRENTAFVEDDWAYFTGILNSETIWQWYKLRGKRKGKLLEFTELPVSEIPVRPRLRTGVEGDAVAKTVQRIWHLIEEGAASDSAEINRLRGAIEVHVARIYQL